VQDDPHSGRARGQLKGFNENFQLLTTKGESMLKDNKIVFDWIKKLDRGRFFITIHSYSLHEQFFPWIRFFNEFYQAVPKDFLDSLDSQEKREWDYLLNMLQKNPGKINSVLGDELVKKYLLQPYRKGAVNELAALLKTDEQKMLLEAINRNVAIPFFKSLQGESLAHILTLLDSAIYAVDNNLIGPLTSRLKENNLLDQTILIITADHGNMYNEHKKFGHGPWLYDEVMRVPLIFYLPGLKRSVVIQELAQGVDILPTVLELLSIPIPHQAQGISLVGLMEGRKNALRNEYVFCQGIPEGTLAIRSKDWKLFRKAQGSGSPEVRLFNLKEDAGETRDVYAKNPRLAQQLESRLAAWQKSLVVYQGGKDDFAPGISGETRERIKKTGYW
jgi:arylsulfatase A-like enzyme